MRKLKLQVQMSVDGFVGRHDGGLDWMTWEHDNILWKYVNDLTDSCNTILLGRKMTDEFVKYWIKADKDPKDPNHEFAHKMVDTPKVVFTKTMKESPWPNTTLATADIIDEVNKLKKAEGTGIVVYGGANFVSSLIKNNLIDEYHLFINPAAIGTGLQIFHQVNNLLKLKHVNTTITAVGIVINQYEPVR